MPSGSDRSGPDRGGGRRSLGRSAAFPSRPSWRCERPRLAAHRAPEGHRPRSRRRHGRLKRRTCVRAHLIMPSQALPGVGGKSKEEVGELQTNIPRCSRRTTGGPGGHGEPRKRARNGPIFVGICPRRPDVRAGNQRTGTRPGPGRLIATGRSTGCRRSGRPVPPGGEDGFEALGHQGQPGGGDRLDPIPPDDVNRAAGPLEGQGLGRLVGDQAGQGTKPSTVWTARVDESSRRPPGWDRGCRTSRSSGGRPATVSQVRDRPGPLALGEVAGRRRPPRR